MDGNGFDALTRGLVGVSRRAALRAGLASAAAGPFALLGERVAAATCRKAGKECRRDGHCCSGRCKRGKCRDVPGQDTCSIEKAVCTVGKAAARCGQAGFDCTCHRRLNGEAFCASHDSVTCQSCASDQECVAKYGPGRVCLRAAGDNCCGPEGFATACARPCSSNAM